MKNCYNSRLTTNEKLTEQLITQYRRRNLALCSPTYNLSSILSIVSSTTPSIPYSLINKFEIKIKPKRLYVVGIWGCAFEGAKKIVIINYRVQPRDFRVSQYLSFE